MRAQRRARRHLRPRGHGDLDCGSGAGDNANFLAARGYDVLGFDISESAVATARTRGAEGEAASAMEKAGGAVEFVQASATALGGAERVQERAAALGGFAVALDSALLHCLDDEAERAYVDGLHGLVRPLAGAVVGVLAGGLNASTRQQRRGAKM